MRQNWLLGVMAGAALLGALVSGLLMPKAIEKDPKAQYLQGGEFSLTGPDGKVALSQLKGNPTVLYFGFTFCPDICPIGLTVIRDAVAMDKKYSKINVLFVTVDPDRDDVSRLKEYLSFFNSNFVGLTGSLQEVSEVAKQYGTYFAKTEANEHGEYSVDHTAYFYLIDQNGELVRVLDHDTDAKSLASVLDQLI